MSYLLVGFLVTFFCFPLGLFFWKVDKSRRVFFTELKESLEESSSQVRQASEGAAEALLIGRDKLDRMLLENQRESDRRSRLEIADKA